ncbi:MAG: hypothetical protein ACWA5W_10355 [Phycisphaerales bacterium]
MNSDLSLHTSANNRRGNILVGCLVALGVAVILIIISTVFVMNSWRGWVSGGLKQGITAVLDDTDIEQGEKDEINAHITTLMTRFENKEVSIEDIGKVTVSIAQGPLLPAGIVAGSYEGYIADSELDDEAKADAKIQLARVAHGIYTETIEMDSLEDILEPLQAPVVSGGTGAIHIQTDDFQINLKDPESVTVEDLTELIANARQAADEAEVPQTPPSIDLSDEVAIAIADALDEDLSLWLSGEALDRALVLKEERALRAAEKDAEEAAAAADAAANDTNDDDADAQNQDDTNASDASSDGP